MGESFVLNWKYKGFPASVPEIRSDGLAELGWNVLDEDMMFPIAVLRDSALKHNSRWMREFTEIVGVKICPHGKTTMSPQLIHMQMDDGAWGITAATVAHVRVYRDIGIQRIILANQLIGAQNLQYILEEINRDPSFEFYCLVDSIEAVDILDAALQRFNGTAKIGVLIELGMMGGRSGARDNLQGNEIAQRVSRSRGLSLRGIEAFEGIAQGDADGETKASELLDRMTALAEACQRADLFDGKPILSAGGSSYFDLVARILSSADIRSGFEVILRSGCYLVHDSDFYDKLVKNLLGRSDAAASLGAGLLPAAEVWAHVHSRPEPGRAIVGLGKRDIAFDIRLPQPLDWVAMGRKSRTRLSTEHRTARLDDQHAYLDIPADSPLRVGDRLSFGISHPCALFDRWRALYTVDDSLTITGAVKTYF